MANANIMDLTEGRPRSQRHPTPPGSAHPGALEHPAGAGEHAELQRDIARLENELARKRRRMVELYGAR